MEATMQLSQLNTKLPFRGELLTLNAEVCYPDGCIVLGATDSEGFPYMNISINTEVPPCKLTVDQGFLIVKDYSENQGIEDAMRSEGILGEPDRKCAVGYAICSVYIINLPKGE